MYGCKRGKQDDQITVTSGFWTMLVEHLKIRKIKGPHSSTSNYCLMIRCFHASSIIGSSCCYPLPNNQGSDTPIDTVVRAATGLIGES